MFKQSVFEIPKLCLMCTCILSLKGRRTQNKTSFWIATGDNRRDISGLTRGQSPLKQPGVKTQRGVKCWTGVGGPVLSSLHIYNFLHWAEIQKCGARPCEAARLNKIINTLPRLFAGNKTRVPWLIRITIPGHESHTQRKEKNGYSHYTRLFIHRRKHYF